MLEQTLSPKINPQTQNPWTCKEMQMNQPLPLPKSTLQQAKEIARGARYVFEFACYLGIIYVSEKMPIMRKAAKARSLDNFLFIVLGSFLLVIIQENAAPSAAPGSYSTPGGFLSRNQCNEWKGWMQLVFIMYHYYDAKQAYVAVRLCVSSYIWLTGYGNTLYYIRTGDFSLRRFAGMLWRINFLPCACCILLGNSYMLYYVCPLHTLFSVFVFVILYVGSSWNKNVSVIVLKCCLSILLVTFLWRLPIFMAINKYASWLFQYQDPRRKLQAPLHEWYFRSSLDRYVWIHGFVIGALQTQIVQFLEKFEGMALFTKIFALIPVLSASILIGSLWWYHFALLPKTEYNKFHPLTSWIPISIYILWRNLFSTPRLHHSKLFAWFGCITLETYICQFHIWMSTGVPNGQPVYLLQVFAGLPLLNFLLITPVYIILAKRLHFLSSKLKPF